MTVVEELVSVLGLEIGENALATLSQFRTAITKGLAGVGGMVAAIGAAFAGTVVSTAHWGAEIQKVSQQIGISTDAVQELKYAADATNVGWETMTVGLKFLSKNAAEGADASIRISEALGGVSMRNANGELKKADELLEAFADKIASIKDPIEQIKVAMHGMHGQSGVEKMPLLKLGGEGIRRLREEARDLGIVLNKDTIAASDKFNKALVRLKFALMGVRNEVGAPFIADFTDGLNVLAHAARGTRVWFQELAKSIRDLGQRFGRIIDVGKHAAEVVRKFLRDNKFDQLASSVHWLELFEAALVGIAAVSLTSAAAVAGGWLLAAAPFIIIATMIGLIVDDIAHFVSGGESVLGMAEKWSHAFDPNDSPMIKFFKNALSLLFDLGDPAKWKRVGTSAKEAMLDIFYPTGAMERLYKEHPELLTGTQNDPRLGVYPGSRSPGGEGIPESVRNQMPQGTWDDWARKQQMPKGGIWRPSRSGEFRNDKTVSTEEWDKLRREEAETQQRAYEQRMRDAAALPPVIVNIHGASDPTDPRWVEKVQEIVNKAKSDAKAAISGGS